MIRKNECLTNKVNKVVLIVCQKTNPNDYQDVNWQKNNANLVDIFLKLSVKSIISVVQDSNSRVWNSTQQQVYGVDSLSISMPLFFLPICPQ